MILETLIVKGLYTLTHLISTHGLAARTGAMIVNSVTTSGLATTVSGLAGIALTVGAVSWSVDNVNILLNGLQDLENGNHLNAAMKFAKLGKNMNIHVQLLPDAIEDLLIDKTDLSLADVHEIKTSIQNMEDLIIKLR